MCNNLETRSCSKAHPITCTPTLPLPYTEVQFKARATTPSRKDTREGWEGRMRHDLPPTPNKKGRRPSPSSSSAAESSLARLSGVTKHTHSLIPSFNPGKPQQRGSAGSQWFCTYKKKKKSSDDKKFWDESPDDGQEKDASISGAMSPLAVTISARAVLGGLMHSSRTRCQHPQPAARASTSGDARNVE